MTSTLIKSSARIFGGSAVAGMGFAFGRDIYRGATKKDTKNAIIGLILIALAVVGAYTGGVWIARNYPTLWGSIFKRIGALFILAPSFAVLLFIGMIIASGFAGNSTPSAPDDVPTSLARAKGESERPLVSSGSITRLPESDSYIFERPSKVKLQYEDVANPEVRLRWEGDNPFMELNVTNDESVWLRGRRIGLKIWEFSQDKFHTLTLDFGQKSFKKNEFDGTWLPEVQGSWVALETAAKNQPTPLTSDAKLSVDRKQNLSDTSATEPNEQYFHYGALILPCGVLGIGMLAGSLQRKKRRKVWEAERANANFMQQHGLVEHEDSTLEDTSTGQNYRIEHLGKRRITLFPIGRRGKRAFINIAPNGKYSDFTGMVKV